MRRRWTVVDISICLWRVRLVDGERNIVLRRARFLPRAGTLIHCGGEDS
jgi:hypothetical protein